jgi:hypothetical protein
MPTHPTTQPHDDDLADLADLDALTDELNKRGLPSLRLTPPRQRPHVDTGLPGGMTPGQRIYIQAGMFFWPGAQPIAPSNQPATAADIIARTLQPTSPAASTRTP